MTKRAASSQIVQCLVPSLAGGDVSITDESSLDSTLEDEHCEEGQEQCSPPYSMRSSLGGQGKMTDRWASSAGRCCPPTIFGGR